MYMNCWFKVICWCCKHESKSRIQAFERAEKKLAKEVDIVTLVKQARENILLKKFMLTR
jgi:hypothetical protein